MNPALTEPSARETRPSVRARPAALPHAREWSIAGALVLLVAVTATINPGFLSPQGLTDLFLNASILALLAVGQAIVIITRNIDLSVGSVVGLVAFTVGQAASGTGPHVMIALAMGVAIGAAFGLLSGALVSFLKVPALVVTLGMLYVVQGLNHYMARGGQQVSADRLPAGVLRLGNGTLLGVPYLAIITVAVMAAVGFYLRCYATGREFYAIGSNPEGARLAGIPIRRRVLAAYLTGGALAGLAGVLWLARFGTVLADPAHGWELRVVAAVVVGGVAIVGGVGTVYGAALGALLITTIGSVLVVLKINAFWQEAIIGLMLLVAISTDRVIALRARRHVSRRRRVRDGG